MPNGNGQKQAIAIEYNKSILQKLLGTWKTIVEVDKSLLGDKQLCAIVRNIREYSELDPAKSYAKEGQLYKKIFTGMQSYSKDLESKMEKSNDLKLTLASNMMKGLNECFMANRDGYLKKPSPQDNHIVSNDSQIAMGKEVRNKIGKLVSCKDIPLFSKDPSYEDLQSGNKEDSGIRAALGAVMQKNPNYMKESMMDNNNGTVTVRLFQAIQPVDQGEKPKDHVVYKPFYVTVDKSVPEGTMGENALWLGIFEKALVASGMFSGNKNEPFGRPVPANINEMYSKYKSLPKTEWPTRQECPWLINEDGELHKWKGSYEHISNLENKGQILEALLGSKGLSSTKDMEYHPEQNADYKKDQVLETVYNGIIQKKVGRQKMNQITGFVKRSTHEHPEMYLTNLMLCAAFLSSMSQQEADRYMDDNKIEDAKIENGKITSFPVTAEQKFLEHVENEVSERIPNLLNNGDISECKRLMLESVSQANSKLKKDNDPKIASKADGNSVKALADAVKATGMGVFAELSGYTKEQEDIFKDLEEALQKGQYLVGGTKKSGQAEAAKEGLLSNDSYGIVGVSTENRDGKEYKFVHLSGANGIEYDYSKNPPVPTENKEAASNGVVKVELNHFCDSVKQLTVNGQEIKKVELPENMLTRSTISQYNNFLSYFENQIDKDLKGMKEGPAKTEFEKLKGMLGAKKEKLTDSLGKDMKSVSMDDLKDQSNRCQVIIENEDKLTPNQRKALQHLAKVIRLYETEMKKPKGLLLGSIEESMEKDNLLDNYFEDNCAKTVIQSHGDILNLQKGLKKADSVFAKSSKEFDSMKASLNNLANLMKGVQKGSIPRKDYTEGLNNLLEAANAYLDYKKEQRGMSGDSIKAASSGERERIDMATKIRDYAEGRCQIMKHQNLRDALRLKTYKQLSNLTPTSKLSEQQKEFRDIVNSNTLNTILDKADDKTIAKILKNPEAAKEFANKVDLKRIKSNEMSGLEKYRNAAARAFNSNNKEDIDLRRINLARLLLADALKGINPNMKMGDIRKYERALFDDVLSSNTLANCFVDDDISKLTKKGALRLVDKYSLNFRRELRGQFKDIKNMEDKTTKMASKVQDSNELKAELEGKTDKVINNFEKKMDDDMALAR